MFSIALATVIWLAIYHGIQEDQSPAQAIVNHLSARQYVRVPVSVVRLPGDTRVFDVTPNAVVLTVSGEDSEEHHLTAAELRAFVDVTSFPSGKAVLAAVHGEAPLGDSVQDVRPPNVMIEETTNK